MANYLFETITAAQALAFSGATDQLVFSNATSHGNAMAVVYTAGTATVPETVTVLDLVDGKSAVFGTGIYGEGASNGSNTGLMVFPDGSTLFVNIYWPGFTLAITGPWNRFQG